MAMRKGRQDWYRVGLETLAAAGTPGLTIERMTKVLGVTKGSFYHHFKNVQDFREQLITHWAGQYLNNSADLPQDADELLSLLDTIMLEAFGPITEPELAIRIWAHQDRFVRSQVTKVDAARREFILTVFRSLTDDEKQAQVMADMLVAISIGSLTCLPRIPAERVIEMYQAFKSLFGLSDLAIRH